MASEAVERARTAAGTLTAAAARIGAPDPVEAIRHIDGSPEEIGGFAKTVTSTLPDYDRALDSARRALGTVESEHRGEAGSRAHADASARIETATRERDGIARIGEQLGGIAERMSTFQQQAAGEITSLASAAAPAANIVVSGDGSAEAAQAARQVSGAVQGIVSAARKYQEQVEDLRGQFGQGQDGRGVQLAQGWTGGWGPASEAMIDPEKSAARAAEIRAADDKVLDRMRESLADPARRARLIENCRWHEEHTNRIGAPRFEERYFEMTDYLAKGRKQLMENAIAEDAQARAALTGGLPDPSSPAGGAFGRR